MNGAILLQNLPIGPYRIHRISRRRRSILRRLRRRMDRWISIVPISLILISIDCVRFSEVKSSGFGKCRLPVFGSLDFLFPDKVLDIDFCGAALALLLALNQAHLVQLGEQGHRLVMAAAHRVHCFFQREVDKHALLFVQPAVAYGQPHAIQHQAIQDFCVCCYPPEAGVGKQHLRNPVKGILLCLGSVKVIQCTRLGHVFTPFSLRPAKQKVLPESNTF